MSAFFLCADEDLFTMLQSLGKDSMTVGKWGGENKMSNQGRKKDDSLEPIRNCSKDVLPL